MAPKATVTTSSSLANEVKGSLSSASSLADKLGLWLSVAALAVAFLVAALFMMAAVSRRVREFGTLKALGWRTRRVVGQVMSEGVVLGLPAASWAWARHRGATPRIGLRASADRPGRAPYDGHRGRIHGRIGFRRGQFHGRELSRCRHWRHRRLRPERRFHVESPSIDRSHPRRLRCCSPSASPLRAGSWRVPSGRGGPPGSSGERPSQSRVRSLPCTS